MSLKATKHKYQPNKTRYVEESANGLWLVRELSADGDEIIQVCCTKQRAIDYKKYVDEVLKK